MKPLYRKTWLRFLPIVFNLERANQLSPLPDKDLADFCPLIEPYQVTKNPIINQKNAKKYSAECKLAKKGSFRLQGGIRPFIEVKCMRSRTLGDKAAEQRSKLIGIPSTSLNIHKDQYIETDFDLVITSLANAFFQTNLETGLFVWNPTPKEQIFLSKININNQEEALLKCTLSGVKI